LRFVFDVSYLFDGSLFICDNHVVCFGCGLFIFVLKMGSMYESFSIWSKSFFVFICDTIL
jgi:hypothetical protein